MNEWAIDVRELDAHYGSGKKRVQALTGVDLQVRRGEIFGLLGPNGAGKTTLLSCIQGLHRPASGSATVAGIDVQADPAAVKRKLGIQLQRTALIDRLTATELIRAYAALYDIFLSRDDAVALLERFQLADQTDRRAKQMSGGQQQRLALAIAVSTDPEIVLLDEPTEALDPGARRAVWRMIEALREQGRTVVLTTHSMEEAEALCGRVAIMDRGQVVACGEPHRLIAEMRVTPVLRAAVELPLEEVRPLTGAVAARYAGDHLEIDTAEPLATLNALSELAVRHGRAVRTIAIRQPNLEDVYLKLTGHAFSS